MLARTLERLTIHLKPFSYQKRKTSSSYLWASHKNVVDPEKCREKPDGKRTTQSEIVQHSDFGK